MSVGAVFPEIGIVLMADDQCLRWQMLQDPSTVTGKMVSVGGREHTLLRGHHRCSFLYGTARPLEGLGALLE